MTYDKFLAYQISIPDYGDDKEEPGTATKPTAPKPTGSISLFELAKNNGKI